MPSYKLKTPMNIQTGSRKKGDKKTTTYKAGASVNLEKNEAINLMDSLDLNDVQRKDLEKYFADQNPVVEPEPEQTEKKK